MKTTHRSPQTQRAIHSLRKGIPSKKSSFNASIATNYELMLKLYLLNKVDKEPGKEPKETRQAAAKGAKANGKKSKQTTVWKNIIQVINKSAKLLHATDPVGIIAASK